MAFLDNSGDIILDAVLTDTGRKRLAAGDGSFKIVKFALGDDEIDYSLYNSSHASGSAYYDLNILQSPVLEAFTNNTSLMKSKLITYTQNDLLYLPVIELNTLSPNGASLATSTIVPGGYLAPVDSATADITADGAASAWAFTAPLGVVDICNRDLAKQQPRIFDQGIDSTEVSPALMDTNNILRETQYLIELDSRLLQIVDPATNQIARESFIDDDHIASYYISVSRGSNFFGGTSDAVRPYNLGNNNGVPAADNESVIAGEYGTRIGLKLRAQNELANDNYLFTTLGGSESITTDAGAETFRTIDTTIRVTGFTTGYRVDVPFKLVKGPYTP
jgi:hypothetical protein